MSAQPTRHDPMLGEVRFRIPLPVLLPIGSLLFIGIVAVAFAEILLNLPKEAATVVALTTAANVLIALSLIATRPNMSRARVLEILAVMMYPIIIGAGLAIIGIGEGHSAGEQPQLAAEEGVVVSAAGVAFDTAELSLPADEETTITFNNDDSVDHNIAIYEEEGGEELFKGEIVGGGSSSDYAVPALPSGEYYFQCDLHPAMNGSAVVTEQAAAENEESESAS
jgi:plastocyanin